MQPQDQLPPPPHHGDYEFIMNPVEAQKRAPLNHQSTAIRILLVVIGLFALLIVVVIFMKLLSAGGGFDKKAMLTVAQDQTEIARVAENGVQDGVSQNAKNFAITTKLVVSSQRTDFLTYLGTKGYKPKEKELPLKQNAKTDSLLANAKSSSNYDSAFKEVMQQLLVAYQKDLNAAYGSAGKSGQPVLKEDFNSAGLLLTQASQL